jgi:excinuclease ABC subunit A
VAKPNIKLAGNYLKDTGNTFYILDEPTTGFILKIYAYGSYQYISRWEYDLIIEHNMDVIKLADYIIDIGPEGKGGGKVVAKGTPRRNSR